ncbi:MAG: hypothetical protein KIT36_12150 [Alphaproteobacteria bacterium]|nr:hypothetical protein [Alphaproteobacteria bacterium]
MPSTPAYPRFAASRIKLERARIHIAELEEERQRYLRSNPFKGSFDWDSSPPQIKAEIAPVGLAPGAIVGEVIHSIRTALDLMASELARINNNSDRDVYFPISDSEATLDDAIKRRCFDKAGLDAVALLKTFSPYRGGNELLRAIHDLDIQDKHTALLVIGTPMNLQFSGSYDLTNVRAAAPPIITGNVTYVFPKGGVWADRPVVQTLQECVDLVDSMIEAFARMLDLRAASGGC